METGMWSVLLYSVIAVVALRTLLTLMQQHRQVHLHLLKEQANKEAKKKAALEAEQKQQAAEAEQDQEKQAA